MLLLLVLPGSGLQEPARAMSAEESARERETKASSRTGDVATLIDRLADRYGLTAREEEICLLLAQGRSRPHIRERLCVSKNTVDTHVRHAYTKLGIHSNQELLDLIEAERG